MIRKTFEHELQEVKDEILVLGSMVEQAVADSMEALKKRDVKASKMVYEQDRQINEKRFAIENQCMILIATQQPMARDLRLLASMLDVASEMERMGDYAKGIATINIRMGDEPLLKPLIDLPRMAAKASDMLHRALTAFMTDDVEAARAIPAEDDEVDALYDQIYRELMTFVIQDPKVIERANLEKVIAEMGLAQAGLVDEASAAQAGKLLGADILLLGGFNNSFGGEIRIDARLVKVETGEMVKAEEITGSTKKLFKLLKKLSFKMAGNLDLKLTKDEKKALDNLDNEDFEALMCYSKGLEAEDAADYALAAQMYRKALSLNSSYAKAAERLAIVERKKLK